MRHPSLLDLQAARAQPDAQRAAARGVQQLGAGLAMGQQMIDRLERNVRVSTGLNPTFGGETYGACGCTPKTLVVGVSHCFA